MKASTQPMRVVFISRLAPPYYSGAGQAVMTVAGVLAANGAECTILATRRTDDAVKKSEKLADGLRIRRFAILWKKYPAPIFHIVCSLWLLRHFRQYDAIQFGYMPLRWRTVRWVARLFSKPVYLRMTAIGLDDLQSLRENLGPARLKQFRDVAGYLLISEPFLKRSAAWVNEPCKLRVIPKPIDCERFRPPHTKGEREELRQSLGIQLNRKMIVFSGELNARKRPDLICKAMPELLRQEPEAELWLVGPGKNWDGSKGDRNWQYPRELTRLIAEMNLEDRCHFTGQVSNVESYYRAADVLVLPSRAEGVPTALLEGMACGLPCLVTQADWIGDNFITHEVNALIASPTIDAIADALARVLTDPELAMALGGAARQYILDHHSPAAVLPKLLEFYDR